MSWSLLSWSLSPVVARVLRRCHARPAMFGSSPLLLAMGFLAVLSGCGSDPVTVDQVTQVSANLEKTRSANFEPLQNELQRISGDQGLPEQLDRITMRSVSPGSFAGRIDSLIDKKQSDRILERMPEFFPDNDQPVQALTLEWASGFLKFYQEKQQQARQALDGPQDRFVWKTSDGWFIDTSYTEKAQALCGLELIRGMDMVSQSQLSETIQSLGYSGRIIRLLAVDEHLVARLTAVRLRHDWLRLLGVTVAHPDIQDQQLQALYQMLLSQISEWPDEKKPWIVDRAIGLQTYELIRQGHYLSLLSPEEADKLESDGMQIIKSRAIQRFLNQDETYYLDTMRRIIDASNMSYHRRDSLWESINKANEEATQSEHYPQVAIEMLLSDVQKAQRLISDDRARVEAWTLALAHSIGNNPPSYQLNPTTGEPWDVLKDERVVEVRGLNAEQFGRPVIAPRRPKS